MRIFSKKHVILYIYHPAAYYNKQKSRYPRVGSGFRFWLFTDYLKFRADRTSANFAMTVASSGL